MNEFYIIESIVIDGDGRGQILKGCGCSTYQAFGLDLHSVRVGAGYCRGWAAKSLELLVKSPMTPCNPINFVLHPGQALSS